MLRVASVLLWLRWARGEQEGWRMADRFYGFRFEVSDGASEGLAAEDLVLQADAHGCFGWVQRRQAALVGEVRCHKRRGEALRDWLSTAAPSCAVKVYADTKIRLHFSHFKLLEPERDTCFLDAPHQCPDLSAESMDVDAEDRSEL